jgi:uncharacterized membrane protein YhiD involved in acid resistance
MDISQITPLSLPILLLNLALGTVVSLIVAWYYIKFGNSLSNRLHFGAILPLLSLITLLVISIVKSSLALSLGLVGALSIVRFRTAIKDPEELIFLFLAIAIGLGFGADQRVPTLLAFVVIMAFLFARALLFRRRKALHNLYLNIQVRDAQSRENLFAEINAHLLKEFKTLDFRRLDHSGDVLQLTYYVNISTQEQLIRTLDSLRQTYPESTVSIVEQSNLLGG